MDGDGQSPRRFLKDAHGRGPGQDEGPNHEGLYDAWAPSYNAELMEAGYVTPDRCAAAVAALLGEKHLDLASAPMLDLGCGTGLSGRALSIHGARVIDGLDFSENMLAEAAKLDLYRHLAQADLSTPLAPQTPEPVESYVAAVAAGVFSPGHAPAETIRHVIDALAPGAVFVFSLNDFALAERVYEARIADVVDGGWAEIAFKEHGPHLPSEGVEATVYGLRKR